MSNYTILQLEQVQYNINHINKITYTTQDQLEENKKKLLDQLHSIEKTIETSDEINKLEQEQKETKKLKKSIIEIELTKKDVQNQHDEVVTELEKRKRTLRKKILTSKKLESLINVLTYKLFDTQQEFYREIEILSKNKEKTLERFDVPSFKLAIEATEIEKQIIDINNVHEETILHLKRQRNELRKEYALKVQHAETILESIKTQYEEIYSDLQRSKHSKNQLELTEINRRIFELNKLYENDINLLNQLQIECWKTINGKLTDQPLTLSGNHLIEVKKSCFGLLKETNFELWQSQETLAKTESMHSVESSLPSTQIQIDSEDVQYLKALFGKPLRLALREISMKQPRDPISYLGHWLFKYRYNQEISISKKIEIQDLINERERIEKEDTQIMIEREAHAAVLNIIIRAEEESIRNELERIAKETISAAAEDDEYASESEDVVGVYKGPAVKISEKIKSIAHD